MKSVFTSRNQSALSRSLGNGVFALILIASHSASVVSLQAQESIIEFTDDNWVSMGGLPGADGDIDKVIVGDDGHLYASGEFSIIGNTRANNIAKWDGKNWLPLSEGTDNEIDTMVFWDGELYVGGRFTSAGGKDAVGIARWDGQEWFPVGLGLNGRVYDFAVTETELYIGGQFSLAGGVDALNVACWSGSEFTALGSGLNNTVRALELLESGLYAGGFFTASGETEISRVARWDGEAWISLEMGVNGTVYALDGESDQLYVGGDFTAAGEVEVKRVAKWDGNEWLPLGSGVANRTSGGTVVNSLAVMESSLYAGGLFESVGGVIAKQIAKWDGTEWSSMGSGFNGVTVSSIFPTENQLYVAGQFTGLGSSLTVANTVARWNGSDWEVVGPDWVLNERIEEMVVSGTDLFLAGRFTGAGGKDFSRIVKWDGSEWGPVGSELPRAIRSVAVMGDSIFVGARDFFSGLGDARYSIAEWNGDEWKPIRFGEGGLEFWEINDLVIYENELYLGGYFAWTPFQSPYSINGIIKWNGAEMIPVGPRGTYGYGFWGIANVFAVSDTDLYIGGNFETTRDGLVVNNIVRWDGSQWHALGAGLTDLGSSSTRGVQSLVVSGDKLYASGTFMIAGEVEANGVAMWDGSEWHSLSAGSDSISHLAVSEEVLYGAGSFLTEEQTTVKGLAKWDGDQWVLLASGVGGGNSIFSPGGSINALSEYKNNLYVGGRFLTAGGKISPFLAKYVINGVPPLELVNGRATVFFREGIEEGLYEIYRSTELNDWERIATRYAGATGGIDFVDENSPQYEAFYRAVRVPVE